MCRSKLDLTQYRRIWANLSEGGKQILAGFEWIWANNTGSEWRKTWVAGSGLRNTRFEWRKTKDGWIGVEEHQNIIGSRRISLDLVQNSLYFAREDDCFGSGQVSWVLKRKTGNRPTWGQVREFGPASDRWRRRIEWRWVELERVRRAARWVGQL